MTKRIFERGTTGITAFSLVSWHFLEREKKFKKPQSLWFGQPFPPLAFADRGDKTSPTETFPIMQLLNITTALPGRKNVGTFC